MNLLEQLGINGTVIAAVIQFILLLLLLKAVAYKPILKALDERKKFIEDSLHDAEDNRAAAEKMRSEQLAEISKVKQEAQEILQKATKLGEEKAREIHEAALSEANRLKKSAMEEIELEKQKAIGSIREEVTSLALLAAGKVLGKNITGEDQEKMVKDFISQVDKLQ